MANLASNARRTKPAAAIPLAVACLFLLAASLPQQPAPTPTASTLVSVIVRKAPGSGDAPERRVRSLGGSVERRLGIIGGFVADVPAHALAGLRNSKGVVAVSRDSRIELHDVGSGYDAGNDVGSVYNLNRVIQAPEMWKKGFNGKGVGIALIDTGVVPVEGLTTAGKIVDGPDLSWESQADNLRHLDTFGHGTHMAGIMAGRDAGVVTGSEDKKEYLAGVAPAAHIVNVKVADYEGATDVSQVIAAIDWVVQHRNDPGLNIRVLNLSFGTDGTQDYRLDPLSYAAEVAWRKGIVVVVAAGNSGYGNAMLNNPAHNPHVLAVGASKTNGTVDTADDTVPEWSSRGDGIRNPDLVAPGASIASLRAPASYLDQSHPEAVVSERFFRGSGTSQAAAAVSGAAALVVHQRPSATPEQVKKLLTSTAARLPQADVLAQGAGLVDMKKLLTTGTPPAGPALDYSTGLGQLDLARGSARLYDDGIALSGEQDIHGNPWDAPTWSQSAWEGKTWSGGTWNGTTWTGDCWCGTSWSGKTWSGKTWSGKTWSGKTWSGMLWSDNVWTGKTWSGKTWSGKTWSGKTWSGKTWSTAAWGS